MIFRAELKWLWWPYSDSDMCRPLLGMYWCPAFYRKMTQQWVFVTRQSQPTWGLSELCIFFHSKFLPKCMKTRSPRCAEVHLWLDSTLCPRWQALNPSVHVAAKSRHVCFRASLFGGLVLERVDDCGVSAERWLLTLVGLLACKGTAPETVMFKLPCCRCCKDLKGISISH